jgi:hypothetical protein
LVRTAELAVSQPMALELPLLRIGLAGFSLDQRESLCQMLARENKTRLAWELAGANEADVFMVNGARTQLLADGTVRVASGVPAARSLQFAMAELDRPVAFGLPLAPRDFEPDLQFDPSSLASVVAVLTRFEVLLAPSIAQFCLASQVIDQEGALGGGIYNVTNHAGVLVAVVNLRGEVCVQASACAEDFDQAMWTPQRDQGAPIPGHFTRTSLSHLMWQYALRTSRDILPQRYYSEVLYFRRPPRLPQRALSDAHLLMLRELAYSPATFEELQQRTGLIGADLSRALAALYLVGAITSNAKRAAQPAARRQDGPESGGNALNSLLPSAQGGESLPGIARPPPRPDLTAPAPLSFD